MGNFRSSMAVLVPCDHCPAKGPLPVQVDSDSWKYRWISQMQSYIIIWEEKRSQESTIWVNLSKRPTIETDTKEIREIYVTTFHKVFWRP